ncbi:MAG: hypothetical protein KAX38_04955, partial [Candidatus Krumholzibacteria bacterium]|nr:hypothetical protein [Candidatus Krumholzibacteria bacterium]
MVMTSDGGSTWKGTLIDEVSLNDIQFLNEGNGWVVGKDGNMYRTVDGGSTWEKVLFSGNPQDDDFYHVRFMNDTLGFVLGYHGVFRTDDGGTSWVNNWLPVVPYKGAWDMSLVDESVGYLLGSRWMDPDPPLIYRTEDGGLNWSAVEGAKVSVLKSVLTIKFIDKDTGWAGGGVIMKTADGGESWVTQVAEATVREFFFTSSEHGLAVGGRTILCTTNGGATWEDVTPEDERIVDLRDVYFLDDYTGWVVGRSEDEKIGSKIYKHSIILSTDDGGFSWNIKDFSFDYTGFLNARGDSTSIQ